jgi:tetratricopeptide (TPR) repeat protein
MSFFKKLFGNGKEETPIHENFKEGDIFYTEKEGKYQIFKLLKIDNEVDTFHVKAFEEVTAIPRANEIEDFKVQIHHFPIARTGFNQPKFIVNRRVSEDDLLGYFEYIKQTQNVNEIVKYAKSFYQQAHELTNQKNHLGAIEKYSKAIELMPNFYEAIDNRAFCFMDLGKWSEAVEGFKQSLRVNPNSLLAIFSIGECYLRLKEYSKAKEYFERAIQIDPNHPKPKEFLEMTNKLMN